MKTKCGYCFKTKRKDAKIWYIFRGEECCKMCRDFLLSEHSTSYLEYRSNQKARTITPIQWLSLKKSGKI